MGEDYGARPTFGLRGTHRTQSTGQPQGGIIDVEFAVIDEPSQKQIEEQSDDL